MAAQNGHASMVGMLIEHEADPCAMNQVPNTAELI
jgi:hypothetical protein